MPKQNPPAGQGASRKPDLEEQYQRNKEQAPRTENPGADDGAGRRGEKTRMREVLR